MSWTASGGVGVNGAAVDDTDFQWSPPFDSLTEGPREQAEFLLSVIEEAYSQGVIEGEYSVSMGGHVPDLTDDNSGGRKSLSMSFSPVESTPSTPIVNRENAPGTDLGNDGA